MEYMKSRGRAKWNRWMLAGIFVCSLGIGKPAEDIQAAEFVPADIYAATSPAVVLVEGSSRNGGGLGTGSIIDQRGGVLTNAHVILDKKTGAPFSSLWVYLKPERVTGRMKRDLGFRMKATTVAYDAKLDLALLKVVSPPSGLPVLQFGNPEEISIGTRVLAIGHPEQGGLWTLTTGVISAEWEDFQQVTGKHVFQTETGLNRGNSGGPLINGAGHQIGVNTAIARKSKDGLAITSISFSIKSNVAKKWLAQQGIRLTYAKVQRTSGSKPSQAGTEEAERNPSSQDSDDQAAPNKLAAAIQPKNVLENQPEANPETGPDLPPIRPFSLDQLMKSLAEVEEDLESQMEEMEAEIRKRR